MVGIGRQSEYKSCEVYITSHLFIDLEAFKDTTMHTIARFLVEKFRDSDLVWFFEDRTNWKIPSKITPPLYEVGKSL